MRTIPAFRHLPAIGLLGLGTLLPGADWPMYRGAQVDGIAAAPIPAWPSGEPAVVWKVPINTGFSSFAVGGGRVFTQVVRDGKEICLALDAASGRELWATVVDEGKGYSGGGRGDGPRSTPAVAGNLVYVLTPNLFLHAVDAATGRPVWRHELLKEYGGKNIQWKNAASPVVEGDLVMVAVGSGGGSYLAFNRATGVLAWKTGNEALTHSTPAIATIHGVRQVVFVAQSGLVALGLDGRQLWKQPFKFDTSTAISPVVSGDIVYCSAGYGVGGGACRVAKTGNGFGATQLWFKPGNKELANHWSTPVVIDGHLYGMYGFKQHNTGPMKCVELATGTVKWEQPGFGQGNLIVAGGRILALAEDCHLVAIDPSPAGYKEIARTKVLGGKCWSTPAYADGRVYIRSTENGACLDLARK